MSKPKEMPVPPKLQAFKINLSKGDPIPCDADELPQAILAIKTGAPCKMRKGVFNPSYYISITEDRERIAEVERENANIRQQNEHEYKYGAGKNYQEYKGMQPLKDIFEGINLSAGSTLQAPKEGSRPPELPTPPKKKKEEGEYRPK